MTATKKRSGLGVSFDALKSLQAVSLTLDKLIGESDLLTASKEASSSITFSDTSLEEIAQELFSPSLVDAMDDFISQYSSPSFDSLDALLEASVGLNSTYAPKQQQASQNLFEGLDSLFDD